jgi:hypothetical protein
VALASSFTHYFSGESWITVVAAVAGLVGSAAVALITARPRRGLPAPIHLPNAAWMVPAAREATVEERLLELSESMQKSARLVNQVSSELAARAATARQLKEEAENAEAFAALHQEQTVAVRRLLEAD